MASGTPVLATQAGGPPEILGHGDYGFLCQARDSGSMASRLREILEDPETRQQKSEWVRVQD